MLLTHKVNLAIFAATTLAPVSAFAFPGGSVDAPGAKPQQTPGSERDCDMPPPTSTKPTPEFQEALKCIRLLGFDIGDRMACTSDDLQRPPKCPPEKGSEREDPLGYTNCGYQQQISPETAAIYRDLLEGLDIPVDTETASQVAAEQAKGGAAWVECDTAGPELLETAIHEACHLTRQCDKGKPPSEIEAAKCAENELRRIRREKRFTTCRLILDRWGLLRPEKPQSSSD